MQKTSEFLKLSLICQFNFEVYKLNRLTLKYINWVGFYLN